MRRESMGGGPERNMAQCLSQLPFLVAKFGFKLVNERPKTLGVIHVAGVAEFMDEQVVNQVGRQKQQASV